MRCHSLRWGLIWQKLSEVPFLQYTLWQLDHIHPSNFLLGLQSFPCLLLWLTALLQSSSKLWFQSWTFSPLCPQIWSSCQIFGFYQNNGASWVLPFFIYIYIFFYYHSESPLSLSFLQMLVWLLYLIFFQLP